MSVSAITMVHKDYWALTQWYRHYARQLGPDNLYVVAHGADPRIQQICPLASVITIPRRDLSGFDKVRGDFLNLLQASLLQHFDWVIRCDVDELICVDPALYDGLSDMLARQRGPALFALGLDLVQVDGDAELMPADSALRHRRNAVFNGHYSKAFAVSEFVSLMRHGVQMRPRKVDGFPFLLPQGVYLVHLKYANLPALAEADARRAEFGRLSGKGLPGRAWSEAEQNTAEFFEYFEKLPCVPWETAQTAAFETLSTDPKRTRDEGLVQARQIRLRERTRLPDWFRNL